MVIAGCGVSGYVQVVCVSHFELLQAARGAHGKQLQGVADGMHVVTVRRGPEDGIAAGFVLIACGNLVAGMEIDAARAVRQIIDSFCQGSVEELVSGMVEAKVLSKGELETLEEFVRSRKGAK